MAPPAATSPFSGHNLPEDQDVIRNKTTAPDFALLDETGTTRTLAGLRQGRPLLLLFLRFADCPTTRRDLLAYANVWGRVRSLGAEMAAVTVEPPDAHRRLKERLELPFPLLSDEGFAVSEQYGVYRSDEVDEGPQPHGEPAVYVIDADGEVAYGQVLSGPKGIANPAEVAMVLLYMRDHGGKYW